MRARLAWAGSRALLRRQRALFVPCATIIVMACTIGFLTSAALSGRPLAIELVRFLIAGISATAVALSFLVFSSWAVGARSLGPIIRLTIAMLLASLTLWLMRAPPEGGAVAGVSFLTLAWVLILGSVFVWRYSEDVVRDLGFARSTRLQLDQSYRLTSRVNELMAAAGREWFAIYGAAVDQHVSQPIRDLQRRASGLGNAALAEIRRPVAKVA